MSTYSELVGRSNVRGSTIRPWDTPASELANYWPHTAGQSVDWVLTQPIQDLVNQGKALGWTNLGTIGDEYHRRRHGDHTPWSAGKVRNVLYAKDTKHPSWLREELVKLCKSDYFTLWIDFFNVDGRQYDAGGNYLGSSSDYHLHISVAKGHELRRVHLFADLDRIHRGLPPVGEEDDVNLTDNAPLISNSWMQSYFADDPRVLDGLLVQTCLTEGWGYSRKANDELSAVKTAVAEIAAKVDRLAAGGVDYAALAKAVNDDAAARLAS